MAIFSKLQYKGQPELLVWQAPEAFRPHLHELAEARVLEALPEAGSLAFALVFVTQQAEVAQLAPALDRLLPGDALLWMAYPKQSSRRWQTDLIRDRGWTALGQHGWEPVRQVAIDADWSALRFRRIAYIKRFTRPASAALSEEGQRRGRS